jgi:hypothetical protein
MTSENRPVLVCIKWGRGPLTWRRFQDFCWPWYATMAHTSPVELARLVRQGVALFFVFMLSTELPARIVHFGQQLIWPGPGASWETLEQLGVLLAYLLTLVCALFFAQRELGRTPLLKSYPPGEPIPLALHALGMASGLLALFVQR